MNDVKIIIDTLNRRFDDIQKRLDDSIADGKDKHNAQQKAIDIHSKSIKELNDEIIGLRPMKKFYDKMRDFSMGIIILLGSVVLALAGYIKAHFLR